MLEVTKFRRLPCLSVNEEFSGTHYDAVAEPTVNTGLRFSFAKCRGTQESPLTFILSNQGKGEYNRKVL